MALINCPECRKEISDTVENCPHCGYSFKPKTESKSKIEKKSGVFQIISIVTFVIALFTPKLFLNFFVLIVVGSAIISLIRREKRWGLSFIALLLGFFLLILPAINESQEILYKDKVSVVDWNWEKERNYSYIRGRIRNDGDRTISYFKIKAYYLDDYGNVLDTDIDNDLEDLLPGMSKEFEIMHKNNPDYDKVRVEVDEVRIK
jgi:hypothetical protein